MIDRRRSGERPGGASFKTPLGVRAGLTLGLQWLCEVKLVDGFTIHLLGRTIFRDPFLAGTRSPHSPQDRQKSLEKPALSGLPPGGAYFSMASMASGYVKVFAYNLDPLEYILLAFTS